MLKFIHNYLNDRKIKMRIRNTLSKNLTTNAGVPQGGVMSTTCSLVAINPILDTLPTDIKGSLHAENLVINSTSNRLQISARELQIFIGKLETMAQSMGLRLSSPKVKWSTFIENLGR